MLYPHFTVYTQIYTTFFMVALTKGPPSSLSCGSLQVSTVASNSLTVRWQKPQITGRSDFYYTLKHTNPDDPFGDLIVTFPKITTPPNQVQVSQEITGLRPDTEYHIEVSVHNGVSDQDPDNAPDRVCEIRETTSEGSKLG